MNSKTVILTFTLVIALTQLGVVNGQSLKCPSDASIAPCVCLSPNATTGFEGALQCIGAAVVQATITNLIDRVTIINNETRTLRLDEFIISYTQLTTLDLNRFGNFEDPIFEIGHFRLLQNPRLTNITQPLNSSIKFVTDLLTVSDSGLDNAPITRLLRYVQNSVRGNLEVHLPRNKIKGNSAGSPILSETPGILTSDLPKIQTLSLANNNIQTILGGAFAVPRRNVGDTLVTFDLSNNPISRIGPDAFRLEPNTNPYTGQVEINLASTTLSDEKIDPDFLPERRSTDAQRTYILNLQNNRFTHLNEGKFRKLLSSGTISRMDLTGNTGFVCDRNVQWLRAGKGSFQNRVEGAICSNDLGSTIFDTTELFDCPPADEISPCICTAEAHMDSDSTGTLSCGVDRPSVSIDQTHIDKLFASLHYANSYPSNFKIFSLTISQTNLAHLDLNAAAGLRFQHLIISQNPFLSSIAIPKTSGTTSSAFAAEIISIFENPLLNNENVGNALSFIQPGSGVTSIRLSSNQIRAMPTNTPLIPGLSTFTSLVDLDLSGNDIEELSSGNFNNLSTSLLRVDLSNSNIEGVRAGSLNFQANLTIILDNNEIADERVERGFIPLSNSTSGRGFYLSFRDNSFDFLGQENFEQQLYPNGPVQQLEMKGNRFTCDEKMLFLYQSNRTFEWRRRVKHVACQNEPGRTVFTADISNFRAASGGSAVYSSLLSIVSLLFVGHFQY